MAINVFKTDLKEILPLRNLFLQENNFQIRYNACHERGWTDSYILTYNETKIGYGSIKGNEKLGDRDTVFEFYVIPSFRKISSQIFHELFTASKASFIECQTNDLMLSSMLYEFSDNIRAGVVLFGDNVVTNWVIPDISFRLRKEKDLIFDHKVEPVGDYVLELKGEVVATGGFMVHYNIPFADLYMEVKEGFRQKGFGSFLIQEIKRECYLAGRVPAARCDFGNNASKATLIKAGLKVCGFILIGDINKR